MGFQIDFGRQLEAELPRLLERGGCHIESIRQDYENNESKGSVASLTQLRDVKSDYWMTITWRGAIAQIVVLHESLDGNTFLEPSCVVFQRGDQENDKLLYRGLIFLLLASGGTISSPKSKVPVGLQVFRISLANLRNLLIELEAKNCNSSEIGSLDARIITLKGQRVALWSGPALIRDDSGDCFLAIQPYGKWLGSKGPIGSEIFEAKHLSNMWPIRFNDP
jgi:hypothetical protein